MRSTKCGFEDVPSGASGAELLVSYGPTLIVSIGFDPSFRPQQTKAPKPGMGGIQALLDTGASESCVDSLLAAQLNLPVIDRQTVAGVSGAQQVNMHLAQIAVPSPGLTIYGQFAGVHLTAGGMRHQALIGRTFLRAFGVTMLYEGATGTVTLTTL